MYKKPAWMLVEYVKIAPEKKTKTRNADSISQYLSNRKRESRKKVEFIFFVTYEIFDIMIIYIASVFQLTLRQHPATNNKR